MAAGELGDQQRAGPGIDAEHLVEARGRDGLEPAVVSIEAGPREAVRDPAGRVVHQDVDGSELRFGRLEEPRDRRGGEQIGLDRASSALTAFPIRLVVVSLPATRSSATNCTTSRAVSAAEWKNAELDECTFEEAGYPVDDRLYLAAAIEHSASLVTADRRLARAARAFLPEVSLL
jgi:hypothetical protein